jgi:hypothetical protein
MTLDDLLYDIHTLEDEMRAYERKYGILSEIFYESYINGEEPSEDAWVQDWTAWASAYRIWQRLRKQYTATIEAMRLESLPLAQVIEKTARHDPIRVPA